MTAPARQTALITGASGGIGAALAHAFARGGYDVILVARTAEKLAAVAASIGTRGAAATVIEADLQAQDAGAALEERVASEGLVVDVLVNNAGFGVVGPVLDGSLEAPLGIIDLNCRALTELSWRFGRGMKTRRRGGILNVASTAAFLPGPQMAAYYASKAYVLSFSEAMNYELRGSGVHVTALCPGPVQTGFQERAAFNDSMRLMALPMQSADDTAQAGFKGFQERRAVVIPGAMNLVLAKSAAFAPRSTLLSLVEQLQKKRRQNHG